jgi:hypothetical protein
MGARNYIFTALDVPLESAFKTLGLFLILSVGDFSAHPCESYDFLSTPAKDNHQAGREPEAELLSFVANTCSRQERGSAPDGLGLAGVAPPPRPFPSIRRPSFLQTIPPLACFLLPFLSLF